MKHISLPALCGAFRYVVHEDISSGVSSPVICHVYDGTCYKLVTDKRGGVGNRQSH